MNQPLRTSESRAGVVLRSCGNLGYWVTRSESSKGVWGIAPRPSQSLKEVPTTAQSSSTGFSLAVYFVRLDRNVRRYNCGSYRRQQ